MDAFSGDLMRASLPVSSGAQRLLARGLGLAPFGLMLDEGVVEVGATMMTSIWGGGTCCMAAKEVAMAWAKAWHASLTLQWPQWWRREGQQHLSL
jgi:hypothetical protein